MEIALGIAIMVVAVLLVAAVLMQSGKDKNLSGAIAGGADTFFGKGKANTIDKVLSKATAVGSVVFAVLVIVAFLLIGA